MATHSSREQGLRVQNSHGLPSCRLSRALHSERRFAKRQRKDEKKSRWVLLLHERTSRMFCACYFVSPPKAKVFARTTTRRLLWVEQRRADVDGWNTCGVWQCNRDVFSSTKSVLVSSRSMRACSGTVLTTLWFNDNIYI